ncbi:hypothetical protein NDU88_000771 [Pleurodeles waltl]|uniref:Uncharacterized protein n=1 Tax=Pleurodeles waltl TaxID=8319 RepID=A0AAV7MKN2_PLEWA|nr:hypothetical protein NDU88_000771 [Pleurodeles waltl]
MAVTLGQCLGGAQLNDQEGVGELQWDYTATQQAFSKISIADDTSVGLTIGPLEQAGDASLELIYRTMIRNFLLTTFNHNPCGGTIRLLDVVGKATGCTIRNLYPLLLDLVQDDVGVLDKKRELRVVYGSLEPRALRAAINNTYDREGPLTAQVLGLTFPVAQMKY